MSDQYYETFYLLIFLIFWLIIPTIFGVWFTIHLHGLSKIQQRGQKFLNDRKWQVKWGVRWYGTPYIKDEGWGTSYSKLSKEDYFSKLNEERASQDGTLKQILEG